MKSRLIFITIVSLSLLTMLISSYSYDHISRNEIKNKFEQLSSLQKSKINELNNLFTNLSNLLISLSDQKFTKEAFHKFQMNLEAYDESYHNEYHPIFDKFLNAYNIYDIFMIDLEGNVVYTVIKEDDYQSNLLKGPYKNSGLANIFRKTINLKKNELVFEDFKPYEPSFNTSASFIATPIYEKNQIIGVFAFQISLKYLNKIMKYDNRFEEIGLGKTGESFLVGEDYKLRSDFRFIDDKRSEVGIKKIDTFTVRTANETSILSDSFITKNHDNQRVLSVFHKINLLDNNWIIITQIDEEEVLKNTKDIRNQIALVSFIVLSITGFFIVIYIGKIIDKLLRRDEELEEINSVLKHKNSILNTISRSIPIPMFIKDVNYVYKDINPAFTKIFGVERKDMIGKTVYDVAPKELADLYQEYDEKLVKYNDRTTQIYESSVKNVKTGEIKSVIFHKNLYFDDKGKPLGIIGAAIDITELKQTQEKLEELNKNLKIEVEKEVANNLKKEIQLFESAKLAAMGSMIGNIIHQWNQPISIISVISSSLMLESTVKQKFNSTQINEEMEKISLAVKRLTDVTNTFRNFLKEKKELKNIILQKRVDESLVISGLVLKEKGIKLIKNIDYENLIEIETIPHELTEVIINIINNAIDAISDNNIIDGEIIVELKKTNNKAIITIEDNAGGIPSHVMPHIFDEYFTTKEEGKGTGLGLYMSYKIINNSLKGDLFVKNSINGAKFYIELPFNLNC